jgi:hypothetical protein
VEQEFYHVNALLPNFATATPGSSAQCLEKHGVLFGTTWIAYPYRQSPEGIHFATKPPQGMSDRFINQLKSLA